MGGKHKQAQRTKNNTRPSSSGRSAELLGSSIPQFVGFSGVKESSLVASGFTLAPDDIENLVDSNFQLVFKKMNKKDATTKLKALQEFTDLVKTAEVEAIKAILPFWPRLYCVLAIDVEHKVREATQLAHHQLVLKAKRNLAPYLKQLAGTWFISQYDTYAPAASAASRAFQDSFPHNKVQEAIIFCQEEILSYICDNLTIQTPQTLSNSKTISPEEAEAKYQRVVISSLNSYTLYLNKMSTDQIEKQCELNLKIISNAKFWKLGKSKIPPIRSGWFPVLMMLCQKSPLLMEKEAAHIVSSVFSNLDENEPTVLPTVWDTALSVMSVINEWWKYVNVDKLMLPKLYKVLRDGGKGNAAVIFPNLLPLLSHIPSVMDVHVVYPAIFENMRSGFKTKNVLGSRSESQAVSIAFIECLQYIIMKNQNDVALCEKLIKTQLYPLLEWSFNDAQACYKSLYNQLAKLVQYWDRNHRDYEKYIAYFWHNLESLFQGLLLNLTQSCEVTPAQLASRQIELVSSLKHLTKSKKHLKVSFNSEQHETSEEILVADFSESYWGALNKLVYKTCEAYVKIINEKRSKELIEHLVCLIQNFDTDTFFLQFNVGKESNFCDIYRKLLFKWLNDDGLCSKSVVDLIFMLFKYFNDEEKMEVLNGFCKVSKEECLSWCIAQTLSHPYCEDPLIWKWFCNDHVSEFLITITEKELSNTSKPEFSLILKQAFTEKTDGDLIISKKTVRDIVEILVRPLYNPTAYPATLDACASFAAYVSAVIYTPHFKLTYGDELIIGLCTLSNTSVPEHLLSADTCWEVNTAWQDIISLLSQEMPYSDFKEMAQKCSEIILNAHTEKSVDIITNFITVVEKKSPLWLSDILILFLKHDFIDKWHEEISQICKQAEYTRGCLCMINPIVPENASIEETNIEKYFKWMDLVISVLIKPLQNESLQLFEHLVDLLHQQSDISTSDLLSTLTLCEVFSHNFNCIKSCQNIKEISMAFKNKLHILINNLNVDYRHALESSLLKKLHEGDWLSIHSLHYFYAQFTTWNFANIYTSMVNNITNNKSALLQVTQIWAQHITYDEQNWEKLTTFEAVVILRCLIYKPEREVQMAKVFALIEHHKRQNESDLVYNNNLPWEKSELIVEIMRLFSRILIDKRDCVQMNHWDLILISFVTWSQNLAKFKNIKIQTKSLLFALSDLYILIINYIKECDNESIKNEWKDVFAQDVHSNLLEIWLYYADFYEKHPEQYSITDLTFLQGFGKMLDDLDTTYIFSKNCSIKWSELLLQSFSLLTHPVNTLQLWGYQMLIKLIPGLVEIDATAVSNNTPHENGLILEQFKKTLQHTQEIVQSMLLEFRLGDGSCRVEPFTDSYTYTFAYLLLWDTLMCLCEQSSTELRYQYSDWLRKEDFVSILLANLFKLIPLEMESKSKPFSDWFVSKCILRLTDAPTSQIIERMVSWIYTSALTQLPVLIRQWWCSQDSRAAQMVERITSTFVSSHLCNQELADLVKHVHKFKNMTIKTHPAVREVVAVYTVDEVQMELVVTLPHNYPLVGPDVHCIKQILGTSHRQWLMQLKMCVLHQDGRIWDGLLLWNNNLDKRFDGVDECYICFAVIHQGTYQIPKLCCQTCKKKFHSACLYKWFSTSNKSSCPVCRNLF